MTSKLTNKDSSSAKSWTDVEHKYDLNSHIDLSINNKTNNNHLRSSFKMSTDNSLRWGLRALAFIGMTAIIGNLPMQSQLNGSSTNDSRLAFKIQPYKTQSTSSNTSYTLASYNEPDTVSRTVDADSVSEFNDNPISIEFELPERALETYVGNDAHQNKSKWVTYHVKSYDNPTNIFHRVGHQDLLKELVKDKDIKKRIDNLRSGSIVRANSNKETLKELIFTYDEKESYVISKVGATFKGNWKNDVFEVRQARTSFILKNGLFFDGKRAGVANSIIKQIVKVFDWDIDFSHDIRVGDKVTAIFEELYHGGDKVGNRHLLAAEFINKGKAFRTIRYTYKDGKSDYFTPQGREMKKAFIRTPIEHARVSSHFNPGRFHPKLHKIRAHKGTDFSARRGTPIMATGNGKIISVGRKGGYGKTIIIKHREGYKTTYAHMSKYKSGMKVGKKVYQGDIIGYVGSTGLATGPHLHYELHRDKKAVDPMRVKLPNSMSLNRKELRDFRSKAVSFVLQLNVLHRFVEAEIEIDSVIGG